MKVRDVMSKDVQVARPGDTIQDVSERMRSGDFGFMPVADGGGECGLENYRLLCRACHVAVTSRWRRERVASLAEAGERDSIAAKAEPASPKLRNISTGVGKPTPRAHRLSDHGVPAGRAGRPDLSGASGDAAGTGCSDTGS